jgi:transposase
MIRLLDSEWERIREHFPEENFPDGRPGRKPVPTRLVLEAVPWILNTGAQWHMLPQCYPNNKTVHRRFQTWCRNEILRQVLTDIANELRARGALDEEECFIDATFAMAKGGGAQIGATKRGKGLKIIMMFIKRSPNSHGFVSPDLIERCGASGSWLPPRQRDCRSYGPGFLSTRIDRRVNSVVAVGRQEIQKQPVELIRAVET